MFVARRKQPKLLSIIDCHWCYWCQRFSSKFDNFQINITRETKKATWLYEPSFKPLSANVQLTNHLAHWRGPRGRWHLKLTVFLRN